MVRPIDGPQVIISLASHEWERLPEAARLAVANPDAVVLLTLPQPASESNCHDCGGRIDRLRHFGVMRDRVLVVPVGRSGGTYGEAQAVADYVRAVGAKRLSIVSSPYHTRRALATFASVLRGSGVRLGIQPAQETSPAQPDRWWIAGYDRAYVLYEWSAVVYYRVKYGVPIWPGPRGTSAEATKVGDYGSDLPAGA